MRQCGARRQVRCGLLGGVPVSRRRQQAVTARESEVDAASAASATPGPGTALRAVRHLARSEEDVRRLPRSASRVPAALLAAALSLPAPHGFTHLHFSLAPVGQVAVEDPSPGHVAPRLTGDPAALPQETLLAIAGERDDPGATSPTRIAPRGRTGRALVARRTPAAPRSAPRPRPRPRRRGRASASRGDPDSEDSGPHADAARATGAGCVLQIESTLPRSFSASPQPHPTRHEHRPIGPVAPRSFMQRGSSCPGVCCS